MTQALGSFGVHGKLDPSIREVLDLADKYRQALCAMYHDRHRQMIDLRNRHFPDLWNALVESEAAGARIYEIETDIKAHHSKVRNRDKVPAVLRSELEQARQRQTEARKTVQRERKASFATERAWRVWFAQSADWKNVKSLAKRRAAYAALKVPDCRGPYAEAAATYQPAKKADKPPFDAAIILPAAAAALGKLDLECDLRERELGIEFQSRGLHSSIRGEIDEASAPKIGSGPGMLYEYVRAPIVRPWEKLTIAFAGGLSVESALEGTGAFRLEHVGGPLYRVHQQIGTKNHPRLVSYRVRLDRGLSEGTTFQRWSLVVRRERFVRQNKAGAIRDLVRDRATVVPVVTQNRDKPTGSGTLSVTVDIRLVERGVQVAEFYGGHICERLVIPERLLRRLWGAEIALSTVDDEANDLLILLDMEPQPHERHGFAALERVAEKTDAPPAAIAARDRLSLERWRAHKTRRKFARIVEDIYKTVVSRACSLHGDLAYTKTDYRKQKRYKTRDLLDPSDDKESRQLRQAVSPGKLQALLLSYGLAASGDVAQRIPADARESCVFRGYVKDIGKTTKRGGLESMIARESAPGALAELEL